MFVHIPKTAGTTLNRLLDRLHPDRVVLRTENVFKDLESCRARMPAIAEQAESDPAVWALRGHVLLSFARFLPPETLTFTFLRDPVERAVSNYYQDRRTRVRRGKAPVLARPQDLELVARPVLDNVQTRVISGWEQPFGMDASREMLDDAKRNIAERLAVVGLAERFDESLLLLNATFGWPLTAYRSERLGRGYRGDAGEVLRPPTAELPDETVDWVRRHNELDRELYDFAAQRFERCLGEHRGSEFERDLATLRCAATRESRSGEATESVEDRADRLLHELELDDLRLALSQRDRAIARLEKRDSIAKVVVTGLRRRSRAMRASRRRSAGYTGPR